MATTIATALTLFATAALGQSSSTTRAPRDSACAVPPFGAAALHVQVLLPLMSAKPGDKKSAQRAQQRTQQRTQHLNELTHEVAQWRDALITSGWRDGGLVLDTLTDPPLRRPRDLLVACPPRTTVSLQLDERGVSFINATLWAATSNGWARPDERMTPAVALLRILPPTLGIPRRYVLVQTDDRFVMLRDRTAHPLAFDSTSQIVIPAPGGALIALRQLGPADSVDVRVGRAGVTLVHFGSGLRNGYTDVRSVRTFARAKGTTEWTPERDAEPANGNSAGHAAPGHPTTPYPTIRWGWTAKGDTVILAASLSNVGAERVLRTQKRRHP